MNAHQNALVNIFTAVLVVVILGYAAHLRDNRAEPANSNTDESLVQQSGSEESNFDTPQEQEQPSEPETSEAAQTELEDSNNSSQLENDNQGTAPTTQEWDAFAERVGAFEKLFLEQNPAIEPSQRLEQLRAFTTEDFFDSYLVADEASVDSPRQSDDGSVEVLIDGINGSFVSDDMAVAVAQVRFVTSATEENEAIAQPIIRYTYWTRQSSEAEWLVYDHSTS
jgi:hypothetical protein